MKQNPTDQIKQKLDVTDVVGSYVQLKKSGKNYKGLCPFHGEKTPSFMVSPELQIFKCFGCGESGDIFSFIEKIEGVEFIRSLEILADRAGVKIESKSYDPNAQLKKQIYFINKATAAFYHYILLNHKAGKIGLDYLTKKRNLSIKTIKEFQIGFAPNKWDLLYSFMRSKGFTDEDLMAAGVITRSRKGTIIDKFIGRIIFPFTAITGKVIGFNGRTVYDRNPKYLNTTETLVFNKSTFLYGLDKARVPIKTEGAVLVEGQLDVVSAYQAGIKNIVAATGTALTEGQLKVLSRYSKDLALCFDSDTAGINAVHRAAALAERLDFNIRAVVLPGDHKDLDDLIQSDPKEAKKIVETPIPAYDYFMITALKQFDKSTPYGKKRIAEDLVGKYSKIKNKVLYEHYAKKLAEELDLSEEAIFSMMEKGKTSENIDNMIEKQISKVFIKESSSSPERYFLALFIKANLDMIKDFMYKLETEDIQNPEIKAIFEELIKYVKENEEAFDPGSFKNTLKDELKPIFTDAYMWDIGPLSDDTSLLVKELNKIIDRIRNISIKKQLSSLSERIKLAETENNTKQLKDLTLQFNNLSQKLNTTK
jgi:DNA primase